MIRYEKYNNNPKGRKTGDCTIRAIAEATGCTWDEILTELCESSLKTKYSPTSRENCDKVLSAHGFVKMKQPRKWDGKKYRVGEMDEVCKYKQDIVVSVAHHFTCIRNKTVKDTWDCRDMTVGNYWVRATIE